MNDTAVVTEQEEKRELTQRGETFLDMAKELRVMDDKSLGRADNLVSLAAREIKSIENFINPHIKRANDAHKSLTTDRAKMIEPIKTGKAILSKNMSAYLQEQDRKRKEEEDRLAEKQREQEKEDAKREEDRRLEEAASLETQGRKEEAEAVLNAPAPVAKQTIAPTPRTEIPKTKTVFIDKWKVEVFDKEQVPDHFKEIKQGALNRYAQDTRGAMPIPGCRIVKIQESRASSK